MLETSRIIQNKFPTHFLLTRPPSISRRECLSLLASSVSCFLDLLHGREDFKFLEERLLQNSKFRVCSWIGTGCHALAGIPPDSILPNEQLPSLAVRPHEHPTVSSTG